MIKFVLLILFTGQLLFAQSAEQIFENIQSKFKSIDDFSADYTSVAEGFNNQSVKIQGKMFYKKEKMLRVEFKGSVIISDGTSLWNYNERMKRVIIQNLDNEPAVLDFSKYLFEYPENCSFQSWDNPDYKNSVKIVPQSDAGYSELFIAADKNFIIRFIKIIDSSENIFSFKLDNVKINSGINASKFHFVTPEGVQSIDLR